MIDRGWLTLDQDEQLRAQAQEAMKNVVARIMEPVDNKRRRIRPPLWPQPGLRDAGVRSDGSELKGLRYEEIDTHRGRTESVRFIKIIADVTARRMETDEHIVGLAENIPRLRA